MSILLAALAALLFGVGTYLVLQRQLSRIVIGVGLLGHGVNVLLVVASRGRGRPPFVGSDDPDTFADPVPQALALTAIVITFGVTALLLALAYRSWVVSRDDEVEDLIEDRMAARRGDAGPLVGPLRDSDPVAAGLRDTDVEDAPAPVRRPARRGRA